MMILLVQAVLLTRKAAPPQSRAARLVKEFWAHSVCGAGSQPCAVGSLGLRHEHAEMTAAADGNVVELIVAARAHEDAQVVRGQHRVGDDIVAEIQIK